MAKTEADKPAAKKRRKTKKQLIAEVMGKIEKRIGEKEFKPTVSDFIRLLQLEREMKQEKQPKEIKVSWVEPEEETEDAGREE